MPLSTTYKKHTNSKGADKVSLGVKKKQRLKELGKKKKGGTLKPKNFRAVFVLGVDKGKKGMIKKSPSNPPPLGGGFVL